MKTDRISIGLVIITTILVSGCNWELSTCQPLTESQDCTCEDMSISTQSCDEDGLWRDCECGGCTPYVTQVCACAGGGTGMMTCLTDGTWGQCDGCEVGPVDDIFEQNDTIDTAYSLSANESTWLSFISGEQAVARDDDYYLITVTSEGSNLEVNVTFDDAAGDLDVELIEWPDTVIAEGNSSTSNEIISVIGLTTGAYYIRVFPFNSAAIGTEYDLRWEIVGYM